VVMAVLVFSWSFHGLFMVFSWSFRGLFVAFSWSFRGHFLVRMCSWCRMLLLFPLLLNYGSVAARLQLKVSLAVAVPLVSVVVQHRQLSLKHSQ
jgi:hypothetical protein